jgi:SAP domain-containing ribonucleoprotein
MTDYTQLKVPELKKILTDRSLPISGNKADLIARLQEDDKKSAPTTGTQHSEGLGDKSNYAVAYHHYSFEQ